MFEKLDQQNLDSPREIDKSLLEKNQDTGKALPAWADSSQEIDISFDELDKIGEELNQELDQLGEQIEKGTEILSDIFAIYDKVQSGELNESEAERLLEKADKRLDNVFNDNGKIIDDFDNRLFLTPLSEETKAQLSSEGYPEEIIDKIRSEEEASIYRDANVEPARINGKDTLVKTDIDYQQKDDDGRTNLERMKDGLAPLDKNGRPIELHHIGQNNDSPLVELTKKEHIGGGNNTVLHDVKKESEIDRESFANERKEHWKERAKQIEMNS